MAADASAAKRYGVAGFPVEHSLSPQMHEAAYRHLGIDATYQRLPIRPELFAETVRALPGSGFGGINVTIPHKHAAAEIATTRSAAVETIGSANTLIFRDGGIRAENTDAPGLISAIDRPVDGSRALVLGAGGTARAAVWALLSAGADVEIFNRTTERAVQLADDLGARSVAQTAGGAGFDLIVNTTAVGMDAGVDEEEALAALRIEIDAIGADTMVVDFVYRDGETPLAAAARRRSLQVVDGRELLARQGALSLELWFDRPAPLDAMRAALAT